ncbi:hypothetical protein KDU71_07640 [Carboxylicivirga sediminis]|uniref:Uncharacterized protein n=1 Tax=Carboxylicivirga sediminis TaxID=2006564 RepID=A0A941F3T0_9BACT|nr:hypothetical protein [Carboxylicivirga sediminis]MBR8535429.1 hypothetical protein [Carboxylicivirga sediminis]
MKYSVVLFGWLLGLSFISGQEKLNNLKAPSSPASSILGLQPSIVLTPKSYQALETALFSNFIDDNKVVVPSDLAIEFTPYWVDKKGMTIKDYLLPETFESLKRGSSFSLASTQSFALGDETNTNALAFGYRTSIFLKSDDYETYITETITKLRLSASIIAFINSQASSMINRLEYEEFIKEIESVIFNAIHSKLVDVDVSQLVSNLMTHVREIPIRLYLNNPDKFGDEFNSIVFYFFKDQSAYEGLKDHIKNRYGFILDFAYAGVLNFPTNEFDFSYVPKQSLWFAPSYAFQKKNGSTLKLIGVFRYEWYHVDYYKYYFPGNDVYEHNFDYGLAINSEIKRFSFNFEFVGRSSNSEEFAGMDENGNELYRKINNSDIQYLGSFNYNLYDQVVLSYTIGNRFEPLLNSRNTLVSTLTLNFGFGAPDKETLGLQK